MNSKLLVVALVITQALALTLACAQDAALATPASEDPAAAALAVVRMKTGACIINVKDAQGVRSIPGASVALVQPEDGTRVVEGMTDDGGKFALDMPAGLFVLEVQGLNYARVESSADATLTECRILMVEPAAAPAEENIE